MSLWDDIGKTFEKGGKQVINQGDQIQKIIRKEVEKAVNTAVKEATDPLKKQIKVLEHEIDRQVKYVEDAVYEVLESIAVDTIKIALQKYISVIKILAPDSAALGIGGVEFEWEFTEERLMALQSLADNPPRGKANIRKALKDILNVMAPSEVSFTMSVGLALGISSDNLEVSGTLKWETEKFLKEIEKII